MVTKNSSLALLVMSVAVLASALWWHRRRRGTPPKKWRYVGELSEILMYPLKSGRAIDLQQARCTSLGVQTTEDADPAIRHLRDRFLVVYNGSHQEYSDALVYPKLRLINVTSAGNGMLFLNAPGMPQLELTLPQKKCSIDCKFLFDEKIPLLDCGDDPAKWISEFLERQDNQLRIGYQSPNLMTRRRKVTIPPWTEFHKQYTNMKEEYMGAFSNISSYMLMTKSSVEDLKSRTASAGNLTVKHFRPNLMISGCPPYEEDTWEWVRIGDHVIFQIFRICTRCASTTIDPDTAERNRNMEPLRTLNTYRKHVDPVLNKLEHGGPRLGVNLGLYSGENHVVRIGDPVYVGEVE